MTIFIIIFILSIIFKKHLNLFLVKKKWQLLDYIVYSCIKYILKRQSILKWAFGGSDGEDHG